ncbi:MAM and LDL-receptor class A domain-containing 1-like, partial [Brachionus plicatilis]
MYRLIPESAKIQKKFIVRQISYINQSDGNLGEIAIDDIFANDGKCQPQRECDFNVDTCEYENNNLGDSSVDLRWILGKPVSDHSSFSNGSLVYVDLSTSLRQNSMARLVGPKFRTNSYECVQFWYILSNAFTPNALSLQVYEVQNSVASSKWSMMSTTLAEWRHGQIQIDHTAVSNYDYSIMFEGQVLSSTQLNNPLIGVDDLKILPGKCPTLLECDFEEYSLCAWSQSKDDKLDWLLNQGETDSYDTGPHIDATLGTDEGVYLFLESSSPAKLDDNAILISDYVDAVDNGCFGLWYFLHGLDVYKLNIYMNNSVGSNTTLAVIVGEQGFAWQHILVNITSASQFRIYIEGIVGNGYRGDIALDDLSYSTSPCGAATSVSVSTRSTTIAYPANPVD